MTIEEQEQYKIAADWYVEMADKGTAFEVEYQHKGSLTGKWFANPPTWDFANFIYRRKPSPKLIPWEINDINNEIASAWFRHGLNGTSVGIKAIHFNELGFFFIYGGRLVEGREVPFVTRLAFKQLCMDGWMYSHDKFFNWRPCGKFVV